MHPHIYHFIYSATANVNTLIRTPSTSKSVDAQATVVDPVVSTSSIISTCFPWKQATSHNLKIPSTFSERSKSIYGFEFSVFFSRITLFAFSGIPVTEDIPRAIHSL